MAATTTYSDVEVSTSTLALDLETSTNPLVLSAADTQTLSVSVDTGAIGSAGDFVWYDNNDTAGSNNSAGQTVVNPISTTISFGNTYD